MKLAIADPPYLGRGASLYGPDAKTFPHGGLRAGAGRRQPGDGHPDAAEWDNPDKHRQLCEQLDRYDGYAIAMNPDNLWHYLQWLPERTRVAAWVKPNPFPAGHVVRSWEPVLVKIPHRTRERSMQARDALVAPSGNPGLIGAKPGAWTRWVLDMLGYDPETDTVDDLFGGSGAVTAEINQGTLL